MENKNNTEKTKKKVRLDYTGLYRDANGGTAFLETDTGTEGLSQRNMQSIAGYGSGVNDAATAMENLIGPLFDGEDLTEEFKSKASTIFESAINVRVTEIEEQLVNQYRDSLEEHIVEVTEELTEKLDEYLNYVVDTWMEENKLQVEEGVRTNVTENFILGLKSLFENCWVEIPDSKIDLVSSLEEQNKELMVKLNKLVENNINLNNNLVETKAILNASTIAEGLNDLEKEKFLNLASNVSFDNLESYTEKLKTLKEHYFAHTPKQTSPNTQSKGDINEESDDPSLLTESSSIMDTYVKTLSVHLKDKKSSKK